MFFGILWVPGAWDLLSAPGRFLFKSDLFHLRQRQEMGGLWMDFLYLFLIFLMFLIYGRAIIEWEAYVETIRTKVEVHGIPRAMPLSRSIVSCFKGVVMDGCNPSPPPVGRWSDEVIHSLDPSLQKSNESA
ncbi:hypothetical protein BCY86_04630 [Pajaroellobacter abortibovis]|uniref:Uncharacterized protein n=1 Tax=Pajaroellobacter abortibovis TaxID=1882918 RepID=A0A1L6MWY5_9BACT|nr:hypothetical protein BCY86_04630 [Pajaroellobacter abortibovis]